MSYSLIPTADYKAACDAIRAKTGKTDLIKSGDMATEIGGITGGGGGSSASKKDVNFYDYDGTLLHSYTLEEAQALTELPPLPTQKGLVCQGWNWTLEDIKAHNRAVDVGATYITDDGKTRLYIKIAAEGRMQCVPLYFTQTVANGVTIDWGDGSATQTLDGALASTAHTYASIGEYVITLDVVDGCTLGLGHGSSSYCLLGSTGDNGRVYCKMLQKVEVGNGVTSISSYAFKWCVHLASVSIPNGVTILNSESFSNCYYLASVIIPNSVTRINGKSFSNCYYLASVIIPNSVTDTDSELFSYCYSLKSIVIPNGVTGLYTATFERCGSLESIVIPNSVTYLGSDIFDNCHSLASVIIPNSITTIRSDMFYNCYSIASISIPDSVNSIEGYAFRGCYGMKFYDFTSHTVVPTLRNTSAFSGIPSDCEIRVPAALYDEWIAATNWSTYADKIVAV